MVIAVACVDHAVTPGTEAVPGNPVSTVAQSAAIAVAQQSCALVMKGEQGNDMIRTRVSASALPVAIPSQAAARKDKDGRRLLHVVSAEIGGTRGTIGVACVVPDSYSMEQFIMALHNAPSAAAIGEALLRRGEHVVPEDPRPAVLAGRYVTAPYFSVGSPKTTVERAAAGFTPRASRYTGSDCCDSYTLPVITVYADPTVYSLNDSEIYWLLHDVGYWPGAYISQVNYLDCPDASAKWFEDQAALDSMIQDSTDMDNAAQSVSSYTCVPQGDGKKTCIDWFITSKKVFLIGNGDGRTFDSTAGYLASRVQMYIDFDAQTAVAYVNHSTIGWGSGEVGVNPYPHGKKDMLIHVMSDTVDVVEFHLYNGFCAYTDKDYCPSIDGFAEFRKRNGEWVPTDVDRDKFPSMAIYKQGSDGLFHSEYQDPGSAWPAQLWTWGRQIKQWRADMQLPRGCQLQ